VPTGVSLRDAREQLLAAADRVLRSGGPAALTSRAITTEAGCAKGVLHKHFADLDELLVALVQDRIARLDGRAAALRAAAGHGSLTTTVADALTGIFGSVALHIVALIIARDGLRARLRAGSPTGMPLLTEAAEMLAGYLAVERDLGRLAADADVRTLAMTLIGTAHLVFAGRDDDPPPTAEVEPLVAAVLAGRWS
jgi:AcrR family transcriptional regulator